MSRRSLQWRKRIIQAVSKGKNVNDLMPDNVKGEGVYLTGLKYDSEAGADFQFTNPSPGKGRGNQVSLPMSQRREEWVRMIAKRMEK